MRTGDFLQEVVHKLPLTLFERAQLRSPPEWTNEWDIHKVPPPRVDETLKVEGHDMTVANWLLDDTFGLGGVRKHLEHVNSCSTKQVDIMSGIHGPWQIRYQMVPENAEGSNLEVITTLELTPKSMPRKWPSNLHVSFCFQTNDDGTVTPVVEAMAAATKFQTVVRENWEVIARLYPKIPFPYHGVPLSTIYQGIMAYRKVHSFPPLFCWLVWVIPSTSLVFAVRRPRKRPHPRASLPVRKKRYSETLLRLRRHPRRAQT